MAGYKIPKPFQDEDKYFRYFTKKQIAYVSIPVILTLFILFKLWSAPTIVTFVASFISATLLFASIIFAFFPMPKDRYLWGGGTSIEKLAIRLVQKRISRKKRVLWVKNYGDHEPPTTTPASKFGFVQKIFKFEDD